MCNCMKDYEITYQEGEKMGAKKFWIVRASSAQAALKAFNKIMRKKSFRAIEIKPIS